MSNYKWGGVLLLLLSGEKKKKELFYYCFLISGGPGCTGPTYQVSQLLYPLLE